MVVGVEQTERYGHWIRTEEMSNPDVALMEQDRLADTGLLGADVMCLWRQASHPLAM
jgi:hypothetical protein